MVNQLRKDIREALRWLKTIIGRGLSWLFNLLSPLANTFFSLTWEGALIRTVLLPLAFFTWTWFAYTTQPPDFSNLTPDTPPRPEQDGGLSPVLGMVNQLLFLWRFIVALLEPYFIPEVLRHVIIFGLAVWIAFRVAAIYIDDIFELEDVSVGEGFIRKILFVGKYERILIRDGDIAPQSKNSPVYRIGGPGRVVVQFENAALFEKIDGSPRVIGPGRPARLDGFERLRAVLDLRDQEIKDLTVSGRTRDGIIVTAKDARAMISIHRGAKVVGEDPNAGPRKLDFSTQAIENLVYGNPTRPWVTSARGGIIGQLGSFIRQHTLNEFLATITPEEIDALKKDNRALGNPDSTNGKAPLGALTEASGFKSRSDITEYFYDFMQSDPEKAEQRGFDLQWLGIGTWDTPEIIPKQHLEAWELSAQNRIAGSEFTLNQIRRESRRKEMVRLIQEVPINAFAMLVSQDNTEVDEVKRQLVLAFREKLHRAYELIEAEGDEATSTALKDVLWHLSRW
jgi:hypothetical protein